MKRRAWAWVLAVAVVAGAYYVYVQGGRGTAAVTAPETARPAPAVSEAKLRELQRDAAAMASARDAFIVRCAACHGPYGQGLVAPNLTDDSWLHGGSLAAIRRSIADGHPDKGMETWRSRLGPEEIDALAAFVGTLSGTKPPNPKAPQGDRSGA